MYRFWEASTVLGFHMVFDMAFSVSCASHFPSFKLLHTLRLRLIFHFSLCFSIILYYISSILGDPLLPLVTSWVFNFSVYLDWSTHIKSLKVKKLIYILREHMQYFQEIHPLPSNIVTSFFNFYVILFCINDHIGIISYWWISRSFPMSS